MAAPQDQDRRPRDPVLTYQEYFRGVFIAGLVATSLIFSWIDDAAAHSRTELDEWRVEWVLRADDSLSADLIAEWDDMRARHPFYFDPQPSRPRQTRTSPTWSGNVESWRGLVSLHFPASEVDRALCVIEHESRGNPNALNPRSSAAGLFQFLRSTWNGVPTSISGGSYDSGAVYVPELNVAAAAWLWGRSGWRPWSVRGLCR